MKQFFLCSSIFALSLGFGCVSDDDFNPISFIGREAGWVIETINSDFQVQADAAIAALTDEQISAAGLTRAELTASYNARVASLTQVDDCDRDDVLFFLDDGQMRIIKGSITCMGAGDPTVLASFNNNVYSTDSGATRMTIRRPDGTIIHNYSINSLTPERMQLDERRTVADTLVGDIIYDLSYLLMPD